jgi:hypothetical protein
MQVIPNLACLGDPWSWEVFLEGHSTMHWRRVELMGDANLRHIFCRIFQKLCLPFKMGSHIEKMFDENKLWTAWAKHIPGIERIPHGMKRANAFEVTSLSSVKVVC